MRILVTGNKGQVASALVRHADPDRGLEIISVGRPDIDLAEPEGIEAAVAAARPNVVVNAAAYTAVDRAETEGDLALSVNGIGAGAVAKAAAAIGVPVIQISTDYVFDGTKKTPYLETDAPRPISIYGASKLAGERAVATANPMHVILRTSWVYSAGGTNFLTTMLKLARERSHLRVVSDQWGSPTSAKNIAIALIAVAKELHSTNGAFGLFHMTAGGEATWYDFATAIFAESSRLGGPSVPVQAIKTSDYPTAAGRPRNSRLNCTKLADAYGISLPDWRTTISDTVADAIG